MSCLYLQGGNAFQFNDQDNNRNKDGFFRKLLLVAILVLSAVFAFAQGTAPICLKVKVKPTVDGRQERGVTVRLYKGNNEEIRVDSTNRKGVVFMLERNQQYTVELSKAGRFTRRVSISTELPDGYGTGPVFRYMMSVDLPSSLDLGDDFYMDFPIALIRYNEKKDRFEHSKSYTAHIKAKMEQHRVESLVTK